MTIIRCLGILCVAAIGPAWQAAQATLITNGDFENTSGWTAGGGVPAGWSGTGISATIALQQSGADAIGGSGTSAYLPHRAGVASIMTMSQTVADTGPLWQFDLDFASEDPLSHRTLNVVLAAGGTNYTDKSINLRVAAGSESGRASVQVYDTQLGWSTAAGLANCILIDDDVTDDPLVHHLRIVGDYLEATPSYTISITDSAGSVFTETRNYFYGSDPSLGDGIRGIQFVAYNNYGTKGYDYVIDNVALTSVPEPGTLALLGWAMVGLVAWRWRKRSAIGEL